MGADYMLIAYHSTNHKNQSNNHYSITKKNCHFRFVDHPPHDAINDLYRITLYMLCVRCADLPFPIVIHTISSSL